MTNKRSELKEQKARRIYGKRDKKNVNEFLAFVFQIFDNENEEYIFFSVEPTNFFWENKFQTIVPYINVSLSS